MWPALALLTALVTAHKEVVFRSMVELICLDDQGLNGAKPATGL